MNASVVQAQALAPTTLPSLSLIGVPNCGKTALFNRLTGSRQKVANYPGVTVERKEGRFVGPRSGPPPRPPLPPGGPRPPPPARPPRAPAPAYFLFFFFF